MESEKPGLNPGFHNVLCYISESNWMWQNANIKHYLSTCKLCNICTGLRNIVKSRMEFIYSYAAHVHHFQCSMHISVAFIFQAPTVNPGKKRRAWAVSNSMSIQVKSMCNLSENLECSKKWVFHWQMVGSFWSMKQNKSINLVWEKTKWPMGKNWYLNCIKKPTEECLICSLTEQLIL